VLSQEQADGSERVIAEGIKTLQGREVNYCQLIFVAFAERFRYFIQGKKFLVKTDNMAILWLLNFKDPSGQIARWLERMAEFHYDIETYSWPNNDSVPTMTGTPRRHPTNLVIWSY
jgi:hypothetical protein